MGSLLECVAVEKRYGNLRALDAVSLTIEPGEIRGLIGPNGSGKSTLMRLISGDEYASGGSIVMDGRRINDLGPVDRRALGIAIKFQIAAILPELSALQNVLLAQGAALRMTDWLRGRVHAARDKAEALLDLVGLGERLHVPAGELSHGEQQWLEIVMAFSREPRLVLLDEPTAGMNVEERRHTEQVLRSVVGDAAILIVEHDIDFVRRLSDRLTVLHQGKVVAEGTPGEISALPDVRRAYLGMDRA